MARDPDATLDFLLYAALKGANVDEPEPCVGNIDTLLHQRHLPTLRRIEKLIGCCQGNFVEYLRSE